MTERNLHATVDSELCIGNAMCREAAPDTFLEQETGQSAASNPPTDPPEALFEAVETCPVAAISIQDAATSQPLAG